MSSLFDNPDNWEDDPPVRLAPQPPAWLGKALVWGPAQSQGSKSAYIHPHAKTAQGKPLVVVTDSNDKALKSWRQELVEAMLRSKPVEPLNSAVAVAVTIYVPRPQAHYRTGEHAGELKPNAAKVPAAGRDIDKVARAILDAGQIARWWSNDARVADLRARRRYDDGIGERTWVFAWKLEYPDQEQPELPEVVELGEERNYGDSDS